MRYQRKKLSGQWSKRRTITGITFAVLFGLIWFLQSLEEPSMTIDASVDRVVDSKLTMIDGVPRYNESLACVPSTAATSISTSSSISNPITIQADDYIYQYSWGGSPIILEEHRLIFFTVPKVACSVWKQLFRRLMGYPDWNKPNPHNPKTNGLRYLFHYNQTQASEMLSDPSYFKAIFVRDPKTKFLSAYLDKAQGNQGSHVYEKCCKQQQSKQDTSNPKECLKKAQASLEGFLKLTSTCEDTHWGLQSDRMGETRDAPEIWNQIGFVGHLESVAEDAERLLRKLCLWEDFGATGWGKFGNESIFASTSNVRHATLAKTSSKNLQDPNAEKTRQESRKKEQLARYYTPALEVEIEKRYAKDYCHRILNLERRMIFADGDKSRIESLCHSLN